MSTQVKVAVLPNCDLCSARGDKRPAEYDAKTQMGPWAYLCELHFAQVGPGQLGTGYGQRLVLEGEDR